jgi:hypothetical protein
MKLPRKYRILTALVALFSMLFMQLALASYACPALQGGDMSPSMVHDGSSAQSMPGCEQPDPDTPALCHAHCLDGKSSLDKPQTPVASPAAVIVSAILIRIEPLLPPRSSGDQPDFLLSRITSPPIAIRHCCFRI